MLLLRGTVNRSKLTIDEVSGFAYLLLLMGQRGMHITNGMGRNRQRGRNDERGTTIIGMEITNNNQHHHNGRREPEGRNNNLLQRRNR
jgi:hypothetical protein